MISHCSTSPIPDCDGGLELGWTQPTNRATEVALESPYLSSSQLSIARLSLCSSTPFIFLRSTICESHIRSRSRGAPINFESRLSNPFLPSFVMFLTMLFLMNLESLASPLRIRYPLQNETANVSSRPYAKLDSHPTKRLIEGQTYSFFDPFKEDTMQVDSVVIPEDESNSDSRYWNFGKSTFNSNFDPSVGFPTASFTLKGRYAIFLVPTPPLLEEVKTAETSEMKSSAFALALGDGKLIDHGIHHTVILSRPSVIQSVRLATVKLDLQSQKTQSHSRQSFSLAGLDLRDVSTLAFQGKVDSSLFPLDKVQKMSYNNSVASPRSTCTLMASMRFDRFPGLSRSARSVETQKNGGSGEWGFDLSDFSYGGEWERRLTENVDYLQKIERLMTGTARNITNHKTLNATLLKKEKIQRRRQLELNEIALSDLDPIPETSDENPIEGQNTTIPAPKTFEDLEGIIVSPDCSFRIILSGQEIDLASLANRVIQFAFFFILKGLLEVRYFLSQVKYTESGGSSAQKVCYLSLGLHTCIDCFEAIIFLTEAITSSFMTSTFVILAIFKLMFVMIVELRYLVIVLKSRYTDGILNDQLSRLVKLHAIGTAVVLIWTLKLLPVIPIVISLLYIFWIPQIVYDIWKGNRLSLSLRYVFGISLCRLAFPLYLWGCPSSIFNGDIFKAPPSVPNYPLCVTLVILVGAQLGIILIQRIFGPRAFVPERWLPEVHNYYRPIAKFNDVEEGNRGYECVICMTEISYIRRTLVTTPCDHHFHDSCLLQWINVKAECPTCRRPLPPFP